MMWACLRNLGLFLLLLLFLFVKSSVEITSPSKRGNGSEDHHQGEGEEESDVMLVDKWIKKNKTSKLVPKSGVEDKGGHEEGNQRISGGSPHMKTDEDIKNNTTVTSAPEDTNNNCQCVKYYECNKVANATNGRNDTQEILGVVDIRTPVSKNSSEMTVVKGKCKHYFEVCCAEVKSSSELEKKKPDLPEDHKDKNNTVHTDLNKDWKHSSCGLRNENGIGFKISGAVGGEAEFGEFPWTVAIAEEAVVEDLNPEGVKVNVTKSALLCGGSLIHPHVVLTAAHCVVQLAHARKLKSLKVRVGEWDTQTSDEPYPYQDRGVKEILIHPQFYRKALYNDIAILVLDKVVNLAPNVDTICLPPLSVNVEDFNGETCYSSGWGKNQFGVEGRYQEIMKKTELPIISRHDCQEALRKTRIGNKYILHNSFICAGGEPGRDTCVGDGGSPLVCKLPNSESYAQIGIVDWGIGCKSDVPGVYVNVPSFVPWILDSLKQRNFDTKYTTLS